MSTPEKNENPLEDFGVEDRSGLLGRLILMGNLANRIVEEQKEKLPIGGYFYDYPNVYFRKSKNDFVNIFNIEDLKQKEFSMKLLIELENNHHIVLKDCNNKDLAVMTKTPDNEKLRFWVPLNESLYPEADFAYLSFSVVKNIEDASKEVGLAKKICERCKDYAVFEIKFSNYRRTGDYSHYSLEFPSEHLFSAWEKMSSYSQTELPDLE